MKKLLILLLLSSLISFCSDIQASYAIGIFHENGTGENIQHKKTTDENYDGICFSKIVIFGYQSNNNINVKIGNSIGHFQNSIPIYNQNKIKIGEELTFKHFNITNGYFQIFIDNKLYDSKVFVK